jgi:hypothetical protein
MFELDACYYYATRLSSQLTFFLADDETQALAAHFVITSVERQRSPFPILIALQLATNYEPIEPFSGRC